MPGWRTTWYGCVRLAGTCRVENKKGGYKCQVGVGGAGAAALLVCLRLTMSKARISVRTAFAGALPSLASLPYPAFTQTMRRRGQMEGQGIS